MVPGTRSYDGSVLLNVEPTTSAWREVLKTGGAPLRVSELLDVLKLVEVCATTTGLRYDGSMSARDAEPILETHESMYRVLGKRAPELVAITHEDEDLRLELVKTAAAEAAGRFSWAARNVDWPIERTSVLRMPKHCLATLFVRAR